MNESSPRSLKLPLLLMALLYLGLMIAGGTKLPAAFNIPCESTDQVVAYMAKYGWTIQLGSFYMVVSAIPLALFMLLVIGRLRSLGGGAAEEMIALLGGVGTPVMLFIAALSSWSLTRPGIAEATGAVRALQTIDFAAAGPGFALTLGFFIGGGFVQGHSALAYLGRFDPRCGLRNGGLNDIKFQSGLLHPCGTFR
jgi:hypothetical protein